MSIFSLVKSIFKSGRSRAIVSSDTMRLLQNEWSEIGKLLKGKSPSQLRQALIMADKTLDNALRDLVDGDTMGTRLKNARDIFRNDPDLYDKLWKAHKARNSLVHESGYSPPHYVLVDAVETIRKGVKYLGVEV